MTPLILLLSMAAFPAAEPAADAAEVCVALDVQPSNALRRGGRRAWAAREVVDLEFRGRLSPAAADRRVELRVLTPDGNLYQAVAAARDTRDAPGRSANQRLARRPPSRLVLATMPVAGTSVTQRGLFGRWTVVPHFAGEADPCGHAVSFELLQ